MAEQGDGIINVLVDDIDLEQTPFLKFIQSGHIIKLKAPTKIAGQPFNKWRVIYEDESSELLDGSEREFEITETVEIRAVYVVTDIRSSFTVTGGVIIELEQSEIRTSVVLEVT